MGLRSFLGVVLDCLVRAPPFGFTAHAPLPTQTPSVLKLRGSPEGPFSKGPFGLGSRLRESNPGREPERASLVSFANFSLAAKKSGRWL